MRFPFSFPPSPKPPINGQTHVHSDSFSASAIACSVAAGFTAAGAAFAVSQESNNPFLQNAFNFLLSNFSTKNPFSPALGSLSLASDPSPVTGPKTGVSFPSTVGDSRRLLGIGLRKKSVFGLKNIDVYAFGVYADDGDIKKALGEKHGKASANEVENKELTDALRDSDVCTTVRLQIVYGKLSIRSVRSAFEESVGNRLQKFGGSDSSDTKELLQRFTSMFKDEYKIPRGSIIDFSREQGNVICTTIDGKEVGSIQSKLLCRSILDLYIGDDPFDRKAKEEIEQNLAFLLQN